MSEVKIPCQCGHTHFESKIAVGGFHWERTNVCYAEETGGYLYCRCEAYKQDNLKYMEQVYEKIK